jgi:hypothetical protein
MSFIDIKDYFIFSNLVSLLMLGFIKINDGEKEICELEKYDCLEYIFYKIFGCILGISFITLSYCKKQKLNLAESFNLYTLNVIAMNLFIVITSNIVGDRKAIFVFIVSILVGYLSVFISRYFYSIHKIGWITIISVIIFVGKMII